MTMSLVQVENQRKCITMKELAEILPLGRNSLYKLVGRDDFPKLTVGKKILVPVAGLDKFLAENSLK